MSAKRVTLVTDELLGYVRTGGIGTATSFLGLALARMGHRVEVLYTGPRAPTSEESAWLELYRDGGLAVRHVERRTERVEPPYFAQMRAVEAALTEAPPDVVVAQDLAAPAYTALRLRGLGLAFENTVFVVICHGGRRWITDTARKVRVLPNAHAITVLEQASVELADAIVSPSRYLLAWMDGQDWQLPTSFVIPYFTRWAATGEPRPRRAPPTDGRVRRISFFGRLEERKGLAPFVAGLNALDPKLLEGVELEFLGRATEAWTPDKIEAAISDESRSALRQISFRTTLDQHEVLERLGEPGTLAVLPSFGETFGNAVRECLEHGIPFIASNAGAVPELVAREDWERVLFQPTAVGVEGALRRALTNGHALAPARSALEDSASWKGWEDVLALTPSRRPPARDDSEVDVVVLHRGFVDALRDCLAALASQSLARFSTIVVAPPHGRETLASTFLPLAARVVEAGDASPRSLREAGIRASGSPWLLLLDAEDRPQPALLETLVRAQRAAGADAVTCSLLVVSPDGPPTVHLFPGEPRGLGVLANGYGTVALLRRSLLTDHLEAAEDVHDDSWPLLARLSASGARIVSVPTPLVTTRARPGDVGSDPVAALYAAQQLESALPDTLRPLARLAAGLGAEAARFPTAAADRGLTRFLRGLVSRA